MLTVDITNRITYCMSKDLYNDENNHRKIMERVNILIWLLNNNKLRTPTEVINKIARISEELLPYTNLLDIEYQVRIGVRDELQGYLKGVFPEF